MLFDSVNLKGIISNMQKAYDNKVQENTLKFNGLDIFNIQATIVEGHLIILNKF